MGQTAFTKFVREEITKYQSIAKIAGINPQ